MQTLAGETTKVDRDGAARTEPPAIFAPRPPQPLGLTVSLCAHAALLAFVAALGATGRLPMPSSGDAIVATLVAGLPQPTHAPEPPNAPRTNEPLPAAEPPPLPADPTASPEARREEPVRTAPEVETRSTAATADAAAEPAAPPESAAAQTDVAAAADNAAPVTLEPTHDAFAAEIPAAAAAAPGAPLTTDEQHMLQRRLASWTGRFTAKQPTPTFDWRSDGASYTAVLKPVPATDAMGMAQLAVEVSTLRGGEHFVTEFRMTRIAFSNFAQFVDEWDPSVSLHADVVDGRFHSNSEIRIERGPNVSPEFRGRVTLAARDVATGAVGWMNRRTMFPEGLETSVRRIPLPARATTFAAEDVDAQRVQRIEASSAITFYGDGSYGWRPLDGGAEQWRTIGSEQHYIVGGEGVELEVHGVVDGTVLVYTPANIVVTGNLTYARDPRADGADDYLGLVAERSIEIAEPSVTGDGDLEIHASLYARHRFVVREFRSKPSGTLKVFGSLAAGSLTATEPRFATQIDYDKRLETMRAPGFPLSDRYELESWSGEWRRAPR